MRRLNVKEAIDGLGDGTVTTHEALSLILGLLGGLAERVMASIGECSATRADLLDSEVIDAGLRAFRGWEDRFTDPEWTYPFSDPELREAVAAIFLAMKQADARAAPPALGDDGPLNAK